ncbi:hypothetical protein L5515_000623 [Caenorhabditis briggsae]|uniref:Uncharacterized protein n=1 Tax=Caenorhabditis briggsae TaxID=6238 RepID=A0AAE9J232_CAEBR|nr:hypothetical protein L5515_000623 [Caenorhabditis briggsae]
MDQSWIHRTMMSGVKRSEEEEREVPRCSWIRHRKSRRGGWRSWDHIQKAGSAVGEPRVKINKDRWTSDKWSWILVKYTVPHKFQNSATDGCSVWTVKRKAVESEQQLSWYFVEDHWQ